MKEKSPRFDLQEHYDKRLASLWRKAPFVLRITEWKDYPVPVIVVKERAMGEEAGANPKEAPSGPVRGVLVERGLIYGESQRRCLPILKNILEKVCDETGIPLELQRYLTKEGLRMRLTLPLDEEAGAKLGLFFKLQERVTDMDRTELMARRIARFTREEALYWLSRITSYGDDANRWAISGLRLMMGGQPKDPAVGKMLERLQLNGR